MKPISDIRFVRMNTGEDLITKIITVKEEDGEYHLFIDPLKIIYLTSQSGSSFSLMLMHWIFPRICEKQEFMIYPSDIITMSKAAEDMQHYYLKTLDNLDIVDIEMKDKKLTKKERKKMTEDFITVNSEEEISDEEMRHLNEMMKELLDNNKRKLH